MDPTEMKTSVPWFSLSEWKQVYADVYSDCVDFQIRGYEHLLMWKARVGQLPAGVVCTLGFVQVHIQDKKVSRQILEGKLPLYAENDLQLSFSVAVMRFLNFIASLAQAEDTLYTMAEKLNIPAWLVALRHDAAHKGDLPSLDILRSAAQFGLEWLNEHYWKKSSQTLSDWVIREDASNDTNIEELIDVWQGLKMYELDGYIFVDELRDRKLREYLGQLQPAQNKKENCSKNSENNQKLKRRHSQIPSSCDDDMDDGNIETDVIENRYKLNDAIQAVRKTIVQIILQKKRKNKVAVDKFVSQLVNSEAFIPSEYFTKEMCEKVGEKLNGNDLPELIRTVWKDLLVLLQKHYSIFPHIVHKLLQMFIVEADDHRQLFMALWIKELCLSMIKWKETESLISIKNFKPEKHLQNLSYALATVEKRYPHLTKVMFSISKDPAGISCSFADIKRALLHPRKYSFLFIPSLLDVASPAVPEVAKEQLLSLVSIYCNENGSSGVSEGNRIFTVEDLESSASDVMDTSEVCDVVESSENGLFAPISSLLTDYDWSKCPFGILPWQQNTLPNFVLHTSWVQSPKEPEEAQEKTSLLPMHEDINWRRVRSEQSAIKKRRREKKKASELRMKFMKLQSTSV